jgi:hypothetical protein
VGHAEDPRHQTTRINHFFNVFSRVIVQEIAPVIENAVI